MSWIDHIKYVELMIRNFNIVWEDLEAEERHEVGKQIATEIIKIKNAYAKQELWRRIYHYRNVLAYVSPYLP